MSVVPAFKPNETDETLRNVNERTTRLRTVPPEDRRVASGRGWRELTDAELRERERAERRAAEPRRDTSQYVTHEQLRKALDKSAETMGTAVAEVLREHEAKPSPEAAELSALRNENAQLRLAVAELRADHAALRGDQGVVMHKVERLVLDRTGPPGARGPQGLDGREGPSGRDGRDGRSGTDSKSIVDWKISPDRFEVTAVMTDGSFSAPMKLQPLLQAFGTAWEEAEEEPVRPLIDVTPSKWST
jgi:hypothetical protein